MKADQSINEIKNGECGKGERNRRDAEGAEKDEARSPQVWLLCAGVGKKQIPTLRPAPVPNSRDGKEIARDSVRDDTASLVRTSCVTPGGLEPGRRRLIGLLVLREWCRASGVSGVVSRERRHWKNTVCLLFGGQRCGKKSRETPMAMSRGPRRKTKLTPRRKRTAP
jgi:hypothetical protein